MTDRPILFSAPMVRALLDGTKTQTRRALKPLPNRTIFFDLGKAGLNQFQSPRIAVGDRLYVREHWRAAADYDGHSPAKSHKGKPVLPNFAMIAYEADTPLPDGVGKHRQGMHLPRWASRITLTVTDVRVERLQDISEADAVAEGIEFCPIEKGGLGGWQCYAPEPKGQDEWMSPYHSYRTLWDRINGPGSWDANPWVAAYTFTVHHHNIDELERLSAEGITRPQVQLKQGAKHAKQ